MVLLNLQVSNRGRLLTVPVGIKVAGEVVGSLDLHLQWWNQGHRGTWVNWPSGPEGKWDLPQEVILPSGGILRPIPRARPSTAVWGEDLDDLVCIPKGNSKPAGPSLPSQQWLRHWLYKFHLYRAVIYLEQEVNFILRSYRISLSTLDF